MKTAQKQITKLPKAKSLPRKSVTWFTTTDRSSLYYSWFVMEYTFYVVLPVVKKGLCRCHVSLQTLHLKLLNIMEKLFFPFLVERKNIYANYLWKNICNIDYTLFLTSVCINLPAACSNQWCTAKLFSIVVWRLGFIPKPNHSWPWGYNYLLDFFSITHPLFKKKLYCAHYSDGSTMVAWGKVLPPQILLSHCMYTEVNADIM